MDRALEQAAELLEIDPGRLEELLAEAIPAPDPLSELALAAHVAEETPGEPVTDPTQIADLLGS